MCNPIKSEKLIHWNYKKNTVQPQNLSNGSRKKVFWICENNHEWEASIRDKGQCPYCTGKKVGYGNDLLSQHPHVEKLWNFTKNKINPNEVLSGSHTKYWFTCSKGHNYKTEARSIQRGHQCPICTGHKTIKDTSIIKTHPHLVKEFSKSNKIKLENVSSGSNLKLLWECKKGHQWEATAYHRAIENTDCPYCKLHGTSKPELFLLDKISKLYPDTIHRYKTKHGEIDLFIPSLNIGIEYDGEYWHKNKVEKDTKKNYNR